MTNTTRFDTIMAQVNAWAAADDVWGCPIAAADDLAALLALPNAGDLTDAQLFDSACAAYGWAG